MVEIREWECMNGCTRVCGDAHLVRPQVLRLERLEVAGVRDDEEGDPRQREQREEGSEEHVQRPAGGRRGGDAAVGRPVEQAVDPQAERGDAAKHHASHGGDPNEVQRRPIAERLKPAERGWK